MYRNLVDLNKIPKKVGVYKFFDCNNTVLYVGKALNLKARVSSYFKDTHSDRPHILHMIPEITRVETIITDNEVESLILESALVKKYQPKYNVELKDDKSFSWIYISTQDKFPKVSIVRSIKKNDYLKGRLFGPYPKGASVKSIFNYIRKIYPFCTCNNPKDLCLYYHLGLCPGPHHGKISQEDYKRNIDNIIQFLTGKKKNLVKKLQIEMKNYANAQEFEKASFLRDKINDLEYISQKISISPFEDDKDYIASRYKKIQDELKLLEKRLGIKKITRIECYDVSNINGKFAYGAMSVALDSKIENEQYRIFKIKENNEVNDISMLRDVLKRRLSHIGHDTKDSSLNARPDLVILDGGNAHLSSISPAIPSDIKMIAVSKGKHLKRKGKKSVDEFWILFEGKAKRIKIGYPFLFLNLRDEAHRFGVKHYRKNMKRYLETSVLDSIEGIGLKRKKYLIKEFKSIENIKKATLEELNTVLKNKEVAQKVYKALQN